MFKSQLMVKEWHEKFGVPVHLIPQCAIPKDRALLRAKLILEEALEAVDAMGFRAFTSVTTGKICIEVDEKMEFDLAKVVDALFDLGFVCDGAALEFGVDMEPAWEEGHGSNMSKMWTAADLQTDAFRPGMSVRHVGDNQYVVKRADGKVIKSPSYKPADFQKVIDKQIGDSRK